MIKYIMKFSIFLLILQVFVLACNQKPEKINYIEIYYIRGYYAMNIKCNEISPENFEEINIKDTILTDPLLLEQVYDELESADTINPAYKNLNSRIRCIIHFANGTQKNLCMGDYGGLEFDGESIENNLTLAYLLKRNSGYYQHFPYEFLISFDELKVSSRLDTVLNEMKELRHINHGRSYDTIDDIIRF